MKLYLVRHAKSKRNAGIPSKVDAELTEDGLEQARRLGSYFHDVKLKKVYCSTMLRAITTLDAIKPYIENIPITFTKNIVEHDMGIYAEKGRDDWKSYAEDAKKLGKEFVDFKPKGGDSLKETYQRARKFYKYLLKNHMGKTILVVGHGLFLLQLILNILSLDSSEGRLYQLSNASVSTFNIGRNGKIKNFHVNDYNHLIREGIKIKKESEN